MDLKTIKELCPKAENITITGNTIAMKVGEFSQAINVDLNKLHEEAKRQVKNLYLDLMAMNREMQDQIKEAENL
jgi:hypothetical protein